MSILDLLDQDEIWIDREQNTHQVATMEVRHAENLVRWLERHALGLAMAEERHVLGVPMPNEDTQAYLDVMSDSLGIEDPAKWLNEKPLMIALRARTGQEPKAPRCRAVPCLICNHEACGWCPECSPGVPEWD